MTRAFSPLYFIILESFTQREPEPKIDESLLYPYQGQKGEHQIFLVEGTVEIYD
jgi:hypothetical protein